MKQMDLFIDISVKENRAVYDCKHIEYVAIKLTGKSKDITGEQFGRLTAILPVCHDKAKSIMWLCVCSCGTEHITSGGSLRRGHTKSCGCLSAERALENFAPHREKHGMCGSPEHRAWAGMRERCLGNWSSNHTESYRRKGIGICKRWQDFNNFYADMGDKPSPLHSLDRIDNNGDYQPDNCRWATTQQQNNNKSNNVLLTYKGKTLTVAQWSRRLGISYHTLMSRHRSGWSDTKVICHPLGLR